jgi:hypothetical protein
MKPIEPGLKLAQAIAASPGCYALLLGSGVSRGASIPSGWEVVLDLIRGLAPDGEPDLVKWYREKHESEPDYSSLLNELAPTSTERRNLLYSYFEPSAEEKEKGLKLPTKAHRAIAELCKLNYIKLILTTNFDRLLETALSEAHVNHDVVVADHGIAGATPYVHSPCYVLKLHGDYRDARLRNTVAELAAYPAELRGLLDRILDDFGLIVCGWSAEWDVALRDAILGAPNRRYTTFWLARGPLGEDAASIVAARKATIVTIQDADQAFTSLHEDVRSLADLARPHPLSISAAVASVERYVTDPHARVRLDDLFAAETGGLLGEITSVPDPRPRENEPVDKQYVQRQMTLARNLSDKLIQMAVALAYRGTAEQASIMVRSIEQLAGSQPVKQWPWYRLYPALLFTYSSGLGALAAERIDTLATLLLKPRIRYSPECGKDSPLHSLCSEWQYTNTLYDKTARAHRDYMFPDLSSRLKDTLQPVVEPYLSIREEYDNLFWLFEFYFELACVQTLGDVPCCLGVHHVDFPSTPSDNVRRTLDPAITELIAEARVADPSMPLLKAGFFSGDPEKLKEAIAKLGKHTEACRKEWFH